MRKAVVTGMGCINSISTNVKEFSKALKNAECGVKPISIFDTENYRTNKAAQMPDSVYHKLFGDGQTGENRVINFAEKACAEAMEMSGIQGTVDSSRFGVSVATSLGCIDGIDKYLSCCHENKTGDLNSYLLTCCTIGEKIAQIYKLNGLTSTVSTACAAGTNSIGIALDAIRYGRADAMICGGADPVSRISVSGFNSLKSLSPSGVGHSFSSDRDGLIIGEGAGFIVLEEYEHAVKRSAKILCEVAGYGLSNDAYHMTTPDPSGGGAIRAIENCIDDAGASAGDIDYINAHGTGTKYNDAMELVAIKKVFGDRAKNIPITSIKGMTGHTLGAAGSIELISTICTMLEGFIPPTTNFTQPIEGYEEYDFVPNVYKKHDVNCAISNSFAFAGNTASIMLRKVI